ncbi:YciI family protein [uncultured Paludibaculum sp.]|uniref:YciI family protein n=1 Tax=uncultured Paludibaculum sp. TaxID=1765020 RepID=UPI002AAC05EA|nr:YciI family protein [uncultured Paludibaculum sp.]
MRFMMIVKASAESEAGVMPSRELIEAMGRFNQELLDAGVLLGGEGLQSSAKGARIVAANGQKTVVDGPFPETKELIAGYWMLKVKSREEAIQWALKCPGPMEGQEGVLELRQVFEAEDFPADVLTPEEAAHEDAMRAQLEKNAAKK